MIGALGSLGRPGCHRDGIRVCACTRIELAGGMQILGVHHVAVICSDYARSKRFYTETLGLRIIRETYREARHSYKLDLEIPGGVQIELFSFPGAPARLSYPEAQGLRHLAFSVKDVGACIKRLTQAGVSVEPVRVDELTGRPFTFFADPDGLPIELYGEGAASSD